MQGLGGITKGRQDHSPGFQECPVVQEVQAHLEVPRSKQTEKARPGPGKSQAGVRLGSGRGQKMVTKLRGQKASRVVQRTGQEQRERVQNGSQQDWVETCRAGDGFSMPITG